jgi:hypothetical protein
LAKIFHRISDFSYDGRIKIVSDYRDDSSQGQYSKIIWSKKSINNLVKQFRSGNLESGYGKESISEIMFYLDHHVHVKNKTVLVIGNYLKTLRIGQILKKITNKQNN